MATVIEVLDDTGAVLSRDHAVLFGGDGFTSLLSPFATEHSSDQNGEVTLALAVPAAARKATKLTSVKGEVHFRAGGEKKTLTVNAIKTRFGTELKDSALDLAKLKISVLDPAGPKGKRWHAEQSPIILLDVTGDKDAIASIDVLDAESKNVSDDHNFMMKTVDANSFTYSYGVNLKAPLNDQMKLRIQLYVGQQMVKVPFELHDIPLP